MALIVWLWAALIPMALASSEVPVPLAWVWAVWETEPVYDTPSTT
jgi:hypothetical protein